MNLNFLYILRRQLLMSSWSGRVSSRSKKTRCGLFYEGAEPILLPSILNIPRTCDPDDLFQIHDEWKRFFRILVCFPRIVHANVGWGFLRYWTYLHRYWRKFPHLIETASRKTVERGIKERDNLFNQALRIEVEIDCSIIWARSSF